jgi:hypothetical protein
MVLKDKTIILSTNDLINYLEEKLGEDIIAAIDEFYDFTTTDAYEDLQEELSYCESCLDERDMEISALENELVEVENKLANVFDKIRDHIAEDFDYDDFKHFLDKLEKGDEY